jgi:hypothetical protein
MDVNDFGGIDDAIARFSSKWPIMASRDVFGETVVSRDVFGETVVSPNGKAFGTSGGVRTCETGVLSSVFFSSPARRLGYVIQETPPLPTPWIVLFFHGCFHSSQTVIRSQHKLHQFLARPFFQRRLFFHQRVDARGSHELDVFLV